MSEATREARYLFVVGVSGLAFLAGLLPLVNMLTTIGWIFATAMAFGIVFFLIARLRQGRSVVSAVLELAIIGVFTFVILYGSMWYFLAYVPSQGASMFQFKLAVPTPEATLVPH